MWPKDIDWRKLRSRVSSAVVGAASGPVVGGSEDRVAIIFFSNQASATQTIGNENPVTVANGLPIGFSMGPTMLTRWEHGDCVGQPWLAIDAAAPSRIGIIEVFLPDVIKHVAAEPPPGDIPPFPGKVSYK